MKISSVRVALLALMAFAGATLPSASHAESGTVALTIYKAGWVIGGSILQGHVIRPLQTLANMVASIREEDFSFRVRGGSRDDSLSDLTLELNNLADRMQQQKISALEATALLKKVLMEIDVAVFTFDQQQQLRIVNRAGEQLMGRIAPRILGLTAVELGLGHFLETPNPQVVEATFPGKHGRWAVSHTAFRENGVPHELLIISDMSRALRAEERQAWQRLIRVLGHELNNSLAPIKSIAGTLTSITSRAGLPEDVHQDVQQGLHVIENRVESLNRFMQAYTQLARMPAPTKQRIAVCALVRRAAAVECLGSRAGRTGAAGGATGGAPWIRSVRVLATGSVSTPPLAVPPSSRTWKVNEALAVWPAYSPHSKREATSLVTGMSGPPTAS